MSVFALNYNQWTTLMQDVDNQGNCEWGLFWGIGVGCMEFSVLSTQFFCKSKTVLKNEIYFLFIKAQ